MGRKTIGAVLGITLYAVACAVAAGAVPQRPAVGLGVGAAVVLSGSEPFPAKAQGQFRSGAFAQAHLNSWLGLGLAAHWHHTAASDLSGGFYYRGHQGAELRPYASFRWLEHPASETLELAAGNLLAAILRYDRYLLTYRYFFHMGVAAEPYLELHFLPRAGAEPPALQEAPGGTDDQPELPHRRSGSSRTRHSLVVSVPLDLYFRRDLSLSTAAGLALSWKMYLPKGPNGGEP